MARKTIRASVMVGMGFLVCWQVAVATGAPRSTAVGFGVYGFVFHVIFGKAYALVPAYFDRDLVSPWGPRVQVPLTASGAVLLGLAPVLGTGLDLATLGIALWSAGAAVFVLTLVATIGTNLHGAETGTGEANRHRKGIDRFANAFVPIALAYFALGTYESLAGSTGLPTLFDGRPPEATHLLVAGTATLLVFSIGARLLPRFFVADPPRAPLTVMLPAAAVAPVLLVAGFGAGPLFAAGAAVLWVGMACYLVVIASLAWQTERRRIGFAGVVLGAVAGFIGVSVGFVMALDGQTAVLAAIHVRLLTLGFLGLTIVGVLFQFYPPAIGSLPGISDRGAGASLGLLAIGLAVEVGGELLAVGTVTVGGRIVALLGALWAAWILVGLTIERGS